MEIYSEQLGESKIIDIPTKNIIMWIDISDDMKLMALSTNIDMLIWDIQSNVEYQRINTDYIAKHFCFFSNDSKWLLFSSKYSHFCLFNFNTQKQISIKVEHFGGQNEICINNFSVISKIVDRRCQILNLKTLQYTISDHIFVNFPLQMDLMKNNNNYFCSYFLEQKIPGQAICFEIKSIQRFRICQFFKIINSNWMHTQFKLNETMLAIFYVKQGNQCKITLRNIYNNKLITNSSIDGHVFKMNFSANNHQLFFLQSKALGQLNLATRSRKNHNLDACLLNTFLSNNGKYLISQQDKVIQISILQ